jgi:hypothetical protein
MSILNEIQQARKQAQEDERRYTDDKVLRRAAELQREHERYILERQDKLVDAAALKKDERVKDYYARSAQEDQQRVLMNMLEAGDPRAQILLGGTGKSSSGGSSGGGGSSTDIRDAHRDIISEYKDTQNTLGADTPPFEEYLADRLPKVLAERGISDGQSAFGGQMDSFKRKQTQQAAEQGLHARDNTTISTVDTFGRHIHAGEKGYKKFTLGGPGGTPSGPVPALSIAQTGLNPMPIMDKPTQVRTRLPAPPPKPVAPVAPPVDPSIYTSIPPDAPQYSGRIHAINRFLFNDPDPISPAGLIRYMERKIGPKKGGYGHPLLPRVAAFGQRIGQALKRY